MYKFISIVFLSLFIISCNSLQKERMVAMDDGMIEIAILQLNDVYEIGGVSGGRKGNLARVAYLYDQIKSQYPCHLMMLAGDFLNPSLINTLQYKGSRIQGRQMIETLNAIDLDLVTFGNHEFDLKIEDLQKRIDESNFIWLTSNLQQVCGSTNYPFYKTVAGKKQFFPETLQRRFIDSDGTEANVGLFSVTLHSNPTEYYQYFKADSCAHEAIVSLKIDNDILVGVTHQDIHDDTLLARNEPDIDLILGGHDHDNMLFNIGDAVVSKADANAKTVFLHILKYNTAQKSLQIESKLIPIDESIPSKSSVQNIIEKWDAILNNKLSELVQQPNKVIYFTKDPLDGRESSIRHQQTNLGSLITSAILSASEQNAQAAMVNSGSIRIDDQLYGEVTGVDIFRVLPFGGQIIEVNMKGSLLNGILRYSENYRGKGAYLQLANIEKSDDMWIISGHPIQNEDYYIIAMNDFLLKGYDIPFLKEENTGIKNIYRPINTSDQRFDIRVAIIEYLRTL